MLYAFTVQHTLFIAKPVVRLLQYFHLRVPVGVTCYSPYSAATELKSSANGRKFRTPKQDRKKIGVHNPSAILVEM